MTDAHRTVGSRRRDDRDGPLRGATVRGAPGRRAPAIPRSPPGPSASSCARGTAETPARSGSAADEDAGVVGYYRVHLWDLENLDRAYGGPVVHPAARRRGYGRALLHHEAARAAAKGRSVLSASGGRIGRGGVCRGGRRDARAHRRQARAVPGRFEPGKIAELRESAARSAAGYSLVNWTGDVPEKYLGPLAHVINSFEDAPRGENVQAEVWDAAGSASAPAPTSERGCCAPTPSRRCTTRPARWPPTPVAIDPRPRAGDSRS